MSEVDMKAFKAWCKARSLEWTGLAPEDFLLRLHVFMEETKARENTEARQQVERELHAAGIIEDPDIDGGILG